MSTLSNFEPYKIKYGKSLDYHEKKYNLKFVNGGDGIAIEPNGIGCEADPNIPACFAFSYEECSVETVIELKNIGIDDWTMDNHPPIIEIIQKVNHHKDCASELKLTAIVYGENQYNLSTNISWTKRATPDAWKDLSLILEYYPPGMRFLKIVVAGKDLDSQRLPGHFGPKIGKLQIEVKHGKKYQKLIEQKQRSSFHETINSLKMDTKQMKNDIEKLKDDNDYLLEQLRKEVHESRIVIRCPKIRRIHQKYEEILKTDIHHLFFKIKMRINKLLQIQPDSIEIMKMKIEYLQIEPKIEEYLRKVNESYWKIERNPDISMYELGGEIEAFPSDEFMEKYRKLETVINPEPDICRIYQKYEEILKTSKQNLSKIKFNINRLLKTQPDTIGLSTLYFDYLDCEDKIEEYLRKVELAYWRIEDNPDISMKELGDEIETIPSDEFMRDYRDLMWEYNMEI